MIFMPSIKKLTRNSLIAITILCSSFVYGNMNTTHAFWHYMPAKYHASASSVAQKTLLNEIQGLYKKNGIDLSKKYRHARIQPIYNQAGKIDHFLVTLNKKHVRGMVFNKVSLFSGKPGKIIQHYKLALRDMSQQPNVKTPVCPDPSVQFVAGSYEYSRPIAGDPYLNSGPVNMVVGLAKKDGYKVVVLKDQDASTENYENYLACPKLVGFFDIGDGDPDGIETSDGMLDYTFFQNQMKNKLQGKTVVFDDCNTFDGNVKNAISKDAKAQEFVGGITEIMIGSADKAAVCFWHMALDGNKMHQDLPFCQNQYIYLHQSQFGIVGSDADILDPTHAKLTEAPWAGFAWDKYTSAAGASWNNLSSGDTKDASAANTNAVSDCVRNGGSKSSCSTSRNHAQFQNCGAMYNSGQDIYMGFGTSKTIASTNANWACQKIGGGLDCMQAHSTVCNDKD